MECDTEESPKVLIKVTINLKKYLCFSCVWVSLISYDNLTIMFFEIDYVWNLWFPMFEINARKYLKSFFELSGRICGT